MWIFSGFSPPLWQLAEQGRHIVLKSGNKDQKQKYIFSSTILGNFNDLIMCGQTTWLLCGYVILCIQFSGYADHIYYLMNNNSFPAHVLETFSESTADRLHCRCWWRAKHLFSFVS